MGQINFDLEEREYDLGVRLDVLESWRQWFVDQGYTPYHLDYSFGPHGYDVSTTSPNYSFLGEVVHPYGNFGGDAPDIRGPPFYASLHVRKTAYHRSITLLTFSPSLDG
jgi:hypothetical protein